MTALPMGAVTFAEDMHVARNTPSVTLRVRVLRDGEVQHVEVWTPCGIPLELKPGDEVIFEVSVRQEAARDVVFKTATHIVKVDR